MYVAARHLELFRTDGCYEALPISRLFMLIKQESTADGEGLTVRHPLANALYYLGKKMR